jgi:arylsulfatase A-like enzyme
MHLDDAVGQIIAKLEKMGKRENTLLIFTSDNGGSWTTNETQPYPADNYPGGKIPGNNVPWRGEKGDLYDGGTHVAAIVSWPDKLRAGKCTQPMQVIDWMPTFCALAGYKPERDLKWDGANMWEHISNPSAPIVPRTLYWTQGSNSAIRDGDWKLIAPRAPGGKKKGKAAPDGKAELFDLAHDPYEKNNLAAKMPEKVAELRQKLAAIAKSDNDAVAND